MVLAPEQLAIHVAGWLFKHPGLQESAMLCLDAVDRAGNQMRLPMKFIVN